MIVLDEADQMLAKDGFVADSLKIKKQMPKWVQVLLFSATFSDQVMKFSKKFAPQASVIKIQRTNLRLENVMQFAIEVGQLLCCR